MASKKKAAKKAKKATKKVVAKAPVSLAPKKANGKRTQADQVWFGKLCAKKREANGWTQKDVGTAVGCRHGWVSAIETGNGAPSAMLAGELLRFLKFSKEEKQQVFARLPALKMG